MPDGGRLVFAFWIFKSRQAKNYPKRPLCSYLPLTRSALAGQ